MVEGVQEASQQTFRVVEQPQRVDLSKIEVSPSVYDLDNRGAQAALIFADKGFSVDKAGKSGVEAKLKGNLNERYGWSAIGRASNEERRQASNKAKKEDWKADMQRWWGEMKQKMPAAHELNRQVLNQLLNLPADQAELTSENLDQLASLIRNPNKGMPAFVEAALKMKDIKTPGVIDEVKNLAGVLFGEKVSANVMAQVINLELKVQNSAADLSGLASELFVEGGRVDYKNNPNAAYLVSELQRLINEGKTSLNEKINAKEKNENSPTDIATEKRLGGRPYQQDYAHFKDKDLPAGVKKIALVCDGHGKEGGKASKFGAQFFEAKLEDILRKTPNISMEQAIKQAVRYADQQLIEKFPDGGTTLSGVVIIEGKAYVVNIGDSKGYYLSPDGQIRKVTKDHNRADIGKPNVLTRSLGDGSGKDAGSPVTAEPDIFVVDIQKGGKFVFGSDGLRNTDSEIGEIASGKSPQEAAKALIQRQNEISPDGDNAIALVIDI